MNSGNKSNAESDQEKTALRVNLESAKEIARQLRLRDMGGIIVIDFIDMRRVENKKQLFQKMKEEMKTDRSKFTILPLSKFGLMQITRQRVRPELNIATREVCPSCGGSGKTAPNFHWSCHSALGRRQKEASILGSSGTSPSASRRRNDLNTRSRRSKKRIGS